MKDKTTMPKEKKNVTTIEFSEADIAAINEIKARLEAENPAYKVPKRAVVSFALKRTLDTWFRA